MSRTYDIMIIGGGPAGMTAAVTATGRGKSVLLLEGNSRVGKKLLSTGNGKCNFTNESVSASNYFEPDDPLINSVLRRMDSRALREWMRQIGIESKAVSGRVYPKSEQAASVLDALRYQLELCGVRVMTSSKVQYLTLDDSGLFEAQTTGGIYRSHKVILAAGSKAAPGTGSDGSGSILARQMGLAQEPLRPALTNLHLDEPFCRSWAGVRCDGSAALLVDGEERACDSGQLQLTAYGISGIPVFQVSRFASLALAEGHEVRVHLSFLPGMSEEDALALLLQRRAAISRYGAGELLLGLLPKNLAGVIVRLSGIDRQLSVGEISSQDLRRAASVLTSLTCRVSGTGNFTQSQVCTGGIRRGELDPDTLECTGVPGLYAAGELIDVDGMCGGYNLQWAFSSGYTAGHAASS